MPEYTRRQWLTGTFSALAAAGLLPQPVSAQPARELPGAGYEPDMILDPQRMRRVEASVDRSLEYLARHQRDNGSWPCSFGNNHGVNAVCLLAFLGRGHTPGRGPFHIITGRAVRCILADQRADGLYASPNASHGPMYEHALATLAMIEAYGYMPTRQMRRSIQQAIDIIMQAQNDAGGWRYQPVPHDADLSVTVMQVVALRAAINARLEVAQQTMDLALAYVRACIVPGGGFGYQPGQGPRPGVSASGCLSMQLLGAFDDPAVEDTLQYLQGLNFNGNMQYFWYLCYYAMQAHYQAGGEHWQRWSEQTTNFLFEHQRADGSWPGFTEQNFNGQTNSYSTAFGAMTLEVYMHYLPAYQR